MERMYNNVPELIIQNGSAAITHIYNYASYLGWTVVDSSITGVSGDYVVIKSEGGSKNNGRLPCYVKIYTNYTAYINMTMFVYWNPADHTWAGAVSYATPTTFSTNVLGLQIDSSNNNVFHFRGNKDFLMLSNYKVSTTTTYRSIICRIDNPYWNVVGHFQDSGPNTTATVTLLDGEVDQFEIGASYRTVSVDGHIDTATVFSKDIANNQMVITGHYYPTASGTCIGTYPFPWVGVGNAGGTASYNPVAMLHNTAYHYSTSVVYASSYILSMEHGMAVALTYQNDYFNHNKISLWPYLFYESSYGIWGHSSYLCYFKYGSEWNKFAVNVQDTGVVDSATTTTLTGMSKNWLDDVLVGMTLVITSGDSEEECRYITANTSDTITFDPEITPTVSGAETFTVCDGVYVRYPAFSARQYFGIKEV